MADINIQSPMGQELKGATATSNGCIKIGEKEYYLHYYPTGLQGAKHKVGDEKLLNAYIATLAKVHDVTKIPIEKLNGLQLTGTKLDSRSFKNETATAAVQELTRFANEVIQRHPIEDVEVEVEDVPLTIIQRLWQGIQNDTTTNVYVASKDFFSKTVQKITHYVNQLLMRVIGMVEGGRKFWSQRQVTVVPKTQAPPVIRDIQRFFGPMRVISESDRKILKLFLAKPENSKMMKEFLAECKKSKEDYLKVLAKDNGVLRHIEDVQTLALLQAQMIGVVPEEHINRFIQITLDLMDSAGVSNTQLHSDGLMLALGVEDGRTSRQLKNIEDSQKGPIPNYWKRFDAVYQSALWENIEKNADHPFFQGTRVIGFALSNEVKREFKQELSLWPLYRLGATLDMPQCKKIFDFIFSFGEEQLIEQFSKREDWPTLFAALRKGESVDIESLMTDHWGELNTAGLTAPQKAKVFEIAAIFTYEINKKFAEAVMTLGTPTIEDYKKLELTIYAMNLLDLKARVENGQLVSTARQIGQDKGRSAKAIEAVKYILDMIELGNWEDKEMKGVRDQILKDVDQNEWIKLVFEKNPKMRARFLGIEIKSLGDIESDKKKKLEQERLEIAIAHERNPIEKQKLQNFRSGS